MCDADARECNDSVVMKVLATGAQACFLSAM